MGMSASQTRYVFLTGRKNDVEYQGQQINQQRTTLATETSAYNAQLLNMRVPTPPSESDFTKTTYTMSVNGQTLTITGAQYQANNYYLDNAGIARTGTNPAVGGTTYPGGTYVVTASENAVIPQGKSSGSSLFSSTTNAATGAITYTVGQGTQQTVLQRIITNQNDPNYNTSEAIADRANTALIIQNAQLPANSVFFKYESNGVTKYVTEAQLQQNASTATTPSTVAIPTYYVDENATTTQTIKLGGNNITWNESGRMTALTDASGQTYSLSVTTTSDGMSYTDAMNEYEYQKSLYDKGMNDINAKMSIIQAEDKKLELKLKDLDTQQEAINTEMDSVKKVVDKNIEQSFKAFA